MGRAWNITAHVTTHSALCVAGYALFLTFGYMSFESSTALSSLGAQAALAQSLFLALALCGRIVACIAVFLLSWRMPQATITARSAALAATTVALFGFLLTHLSFELAAYAPLMQVAPWLVMGGLMYGGGSILVALMWAHVCCTLDTRRVYLLVLTANLLSLAVYFGVTLLPDAIVFPVAAALLLGSIVCCALCLGHRQPTAAIPWTNARALEARRTLWRPTLGTALLFFMSGLMLQMPHNQDLSLAQFQSTALVTQGVVMMALLLPVLAVRRQLHLESVFKIALPLSATGFLLLPLILSGGSGIANACAQLGSGVADIILWCMVAGFVHAQGLSATLPFTCVLFATNTAKLAGTLMGMFFRDGLAQGGLSLTAIALAALYLVAMMSMFLFKGHREPDNAEPAVSEPDANPAQPANQLVDRCHRLADRYGLTPRETELLAELGQGRTVHAIAEKLTVSENTVKYHIRSIYQKMGVHTRDEVIDMISQA